MKSGEIHILASLPEEKIRTVLSHATVRKFKRGEVILPRNTAIRHVYFVLLGRVIESAYTLKGKEIVFNAMSEGDCFGLLSLINDVRSKTDFIAKTSCEICAIDTQSFAQLMKSDEAVSDAIMAEFSSSILKLFDRLYDIRALDVSQRTCAELIRYAVPLKIDGRDGSYLAIIEGLPTHEEIANTIFTHREAVTKEISHLKKTGVLKTTGRCEYIADLRQLKTMVEPEFSLA